MTDVIASRFFRIQESGDVFQADDEHTDCRACTTKAGTYDATWTIYLLENCGGGCGCLILLNHVTAVHDSSGAGDWSGTYDDADQIGDLALRLHAWALLTRGYPPVLAHTPPPGRQVQLPADPPPPSALPPTGAVLAAIRLEGEPALVCAGGHVLVPLREGQDFSELSRAFHRGGHTCAAVERAHQRHRDYQLKQAEQRLAEAEGRAADARAAMFDHRDDPEAEVAFIQARCAADDLQEQIDQLRAMT